jgi:fucose permease
LWRCRTLAQKGRLLQTHTEVAATPNTSSTVLSDLAPGTATDRTVTTAFDPNAHRRANAARVAQAIYLVFGVIEGLLLIRFFLRALNANPDAGFAQAIYAITGLLVGPFSGLFGTPQLATGAALEISTLVALIVYAGIGWILARAAWLILGDAPSSSVATVSSKRTRVG